MLSFKQPCCRRRCSSYTKYLERPVYVREKSRRVGSAGVAECGVDLSGVEGKGPRRMPTSRADPVSDSERDVCDEAQRNGAERKRCGRNDQGEHKLYLSRGLGGPEAELDWRGVQ
jgi:hypothetical protein